MRPLVHTFLFQEDFPTQLLGRKLDHRQRYLFVFEKARSFYTKSIHPILIGKFDVGWAKMSGADKQEQGR